MLVAITARLRIGGLGHGTGDRRCVIGTGEKRLWKRDNEGIDRQDDSKFAWLKFKVVELSNVAFVFVKIWFIDENNNIMIKLQSISLIKLYN